MVRHHLQSVGKRPENMRHNRLEGPETDAMILEIFLHSRYSI